MAIRPQDMVQPKVPMTEEELREGVSAGEKLDQADPRNQKVFTFPFEFMEQGSGRVYQGTFTNKILNIGEKANARVSAARLSGGLPFDALDPVAAEANLAVAWMSYSLGKDRPSWAKNLLEIESEELLFALWAKVREHESFYFRRGAGAGASAV